MSCCTSVHKARSRKGYVTDPRLLQIFASGMAELMDAMLSPDVLAEMRRALEAGDTRGAIDAVPNLDDQSKPVPATLVDVYNRAFRLFSTIFTLSANLELERLGSRLRWTIAKAEVSKPKKPNRYVEVPHDVDEIHRRAAQLVVEITRSQRESIATVIADRFNENKRPDVLVRQIKDLVGLTARETQAVLNREARLREREMKEAQIQRESARYAKELLQARAERIARTETAAVENEARLEAWKTAVDDGTLPEDAQQEWVTSADACELCESLDGQVIGINEMFTSPEVGETDRPPLHPHCYCTVILRR